MDAEFRLRARTLDPIVIGGRVREARIRAGLTQAEAAGDDISPAYISRIESGDRRPGADLLARLAETLGTTLDALLAPDTDSTADYETAVTTKLALDLAELSLARVPVLGTAGDAAPAVGRDDEVARRTAEALETATRLTRDLDAPGQLRREARLLRARALAAGGDLNGAISALEELLADEPAGLRRLAGLDLLGLCHRASGDLARASDLARDAASLVEELGLRASPEGIRVALSLVGALVEQGDLAHAVAVGSAAVETVAALDPSRLSETYRAAADRLVAGGSLHEAAPLAERGIQVLGSDVARVELARLHTTLALTCLRLDDDQRAQLDEGSGRATDPADLDALVSRVLDDAARLLDVAWAGPLDLAELGLARAQSRLAAGDLTGARHWAERAAEHAESSGDALCRARAAVLLGHVANAEGQREQALTHFAETAARLEELRADRRSGEVWLELASTYEQLEHLTEALAAYRAAASAAGLPPRRVLDAAPAPSRA